MLNKRLTSILLGGLIFLLAGYTSSFSQVLPAENLSFSSQVASPADTHCVAKPGDINGDNVVSLADIVAYMRCIFIMGIRPYLCFEPQCRGDLDGDGMLSIRDIVYFINYLFKGGPAPVKRDVCCL